MALEVKRPACPDGHVSDIGTLMFAGWQHETHQISGLETENALDRFRHRTWEAVLVHAAHVARSATNGFDRWRFGRRRESDGRTRLADAGRVDPVILGVTLSHA